MLAPHSGHTERSMAPPHCGRAHQSQSLGDDGLHLTHVSNHVDVSIGTFVVVPSMAYCHKQVSKEIGIAIAL